jgi:parvulin-like peptidyl-prolyl isomerase
MRHRLALLGLCAAGALACGRGAGNQNAAEVDGHPIPVAVLRRAVELRLAAEPGTTLEDAAGQELERLVDERLVLNRAEALGIEVSDADVDARIRQIHGADFQAPDPGYRTQVQRELRAERATLAELAGGLEVSDAELEQRFASRRDQYDQPEQIRIRQIVVEDAAKARALRERLAAGAPFEALARESSVGPEASKGGQLPPFGRGELPEVFDRAFDLAPGQISEVIESPHGYHIFVLEERLPPRPADLASVREELAGELRRERLETLRRTWLGELRSQARIQVDDRLLEDLR